MSRFGKNIGRRILAYLLSGAMIMSNMTAFASEASPDTGEEYAYEQAADTNDTESTEEAVETEKSSDEAKISDNEQTSETESSLSAEKETETTEVVETESEEKTTEPKKDVVKTEVERKTEEKDNRDASVVNGDKITYTSTYDFRNGSIVPKNTDGKGTETSADGKLTVEMGGAKNYGYNGEQHGVEFHEGNKITIHVLGKAEVFIGGCKYSNGGSLTVTSGSDTIETFTSTATDKCYDADPTKGLSFEYNGEETDLVITFDTSKTYVPVIIVKRTETPVKASVTLADENSVLGEGDTIKLVNEADEEDEHDIISATEATDIKLRQKTTYKIVSSNKNIKAMSNGETTITTATEDTIEVTVTLETNIVKASVTLDDNNNLLGEGDTIKLVNEADEEDEHDITSATEATGIELRQNATYNIVSSNKNIKAISDGKTAIITTEAATMNITVTLEANTVAAKVTLNDENGVLGEGDTIKLVNEDDESDEHDITSATEPTDIKLRQNATYNIVSSNEKIKATSDGETTITTEETDITVTVLVEAEEDQGPTKTYTSIYDFRDGSIIPTNPGDGTATVYSADKKLKVECGPSNGYGYNGNQHGSILKPGNMITIHVLGKTRVFIGGCKHTNDTATLTVTSGSDTVKTFATTKTSNCYDQDPEVGLSFEYTGGETDLVMTFGGSGVTYVPIITVERTEPVEMITYTSKYDFRDGSIIPTNPGDGTTTVYSADEKLKVECGPSNGYGYNGNQHGSILKPGNMITIHVLGKARVFIGGCKHTNDTATLTVTSGSDTVKTFATTKTSNCYDQDPEVGLSFEYTGGETDLVMTFGGSGVTYVPIITVERTEPKADEVTATITINDENELLLDGDTITLENPDDEEDVIDITSAVENAMEVTLPANTVYNIVSSNTDIEATFEGRGTVTTTTEDMDVTIALTATVVNPTVKIVGADTVTGDYKLTLTNESDGEDKWELKNDETVKLKIGATYKLESSNAEVEANINGTILLTVTETLTTITVTVSAPDTTHHTYDVWDFGAEALLNTSLNTYNNILNEDVINSWFKEGVATLEPDGKDIDAGSGLTIVSNGTANKWRLRTLNQNLGGETESTLKDELGNEYQGIMYDNAGKGAIWMTLEVKAGDKVKAVVSSNGTASTITWQSPSGKDVQTFEFTRGSRTKLANTTVFTAAEDGAYKLYTPNEKLVVARIYRERPNTVTVSGKITFPEGASWANDSELIFTNQATGAQTKATVTAGDETTYTVSLHEQYGYDVSVEGVESCVVGANNTITLANEAGNTEFDVELIKVALVDVTGSLADLTPEAAAKLKLAFINEEKIYVPKITVDAEHVTYTGKFEKGVEYKLEESGVNDYTLDQDTFKADDAGTIDIKFNKKPVYAINVTLEGPTAEEAAQVKLTFTNINEEGYEYQFTGTEEIKLRDGQYAVKAVLAGYKQKVTSDVKVNGEAVDKTIVMIPDVAAPPIPYKEVITVGSESDYESINDALDAVRRMNRANGERVTISIEPGDYEEMLVVDVPNVTLKNASEHPSIELKDKGVNIDDNAVRITSYYGHGYTYYSMGNDCKWDADVLEANKENGYASYVNPGSGTTNGSYWNATVVIRANGFQAEGIIFENSFNQYMSKKAAEDVIVKQSGAKEGSKTRVGMEYGDVTVQQKAYVERAAALAIYNNVSKTYFENCKFIGRQDTLYGGTNSTVGFYKCSIYGGTDYIFGGMRAVFAKCDLVFNTMDDKNDVGYITAAQQKEGRGYLMYNCHVTSTTPGVDTDSAHTSKPGYFGRPWEKITSEVIFFYTVIDKADDYWSESGASLITAVGWNDGLNGQSPLSQEYGTYEVAGVDNSANRVDWAPVLTEPKLTDGSKITVAKFLTSWNPFEGKDMTIRIGDTTLDEPTDEADKIVSTPTATPQAGAVVKGTKVSLKCATDDAAIYYTDDGSTPTTESNLYTEPIVIDKAVTIKAIAVLAGMSDSEVATFEYTVSASASVADPEADPKAGTYPKGTTVTLTCTTDGATIYYTIGEAELTVAEENRYTGPISLGETAGKVIINAMAVMEGWLPSKVVSFEYTVKEESEGPGGDTDAAEDDEKLKADETEKNSTVDFQKDKKKITIVPSNMVVNGNKEQYKVTVTYTHSYEVNENGATVQKIVAQELTEGVHYDVILRTDGKTPGPQTIAVKGTNEPTDLGTFTGISDDYDYKLFSKDETRAAKDNDISKIVKGLDVVKGVTDTYSGEYKVPEIVWKDGKAPASNDQYKVVYKNNVNAGKASVTVIGLGEYYGSKTLTFSIKAAKVNAAEIISDNLKVTLNDKKKYEVAVKDNSNALTYAGKPIVFENLIIKVGGKKLTRGHDYTITYKNNAKVGKASATIKAMNNFSGSITLNYEIIAPEVTAEALKNLTANAEYTAKKGPQVLEINAGGVTLKAGTDFKADYKALKDDIKAGTTIPGYTNTITITGAGAYKPTRDGKGIPKDTPVAITVVKGDFYIKSGVTIDAAAVEKANVEADAKKKAQKLIAATKITDAGGTKPTADDIANIVTTNETVTVVLTETAKANYNETPISCHVAKKLSSVAKQKKAEKTGTLEQRQVKYFDGVNKVTLTKTEIKNYLESKVKNGTLALTENDFEIVSYKNNHKVGSATVTIEATNASAYYGTMNVKFTIITVPKPTFVKTDEKPVPTPGPGEDPDPTPGPGGDSTKATIWVVGDSTVSGFNDDYYIPRQGYGEQIGNYFNATVYNLALSGRSSKSFTTETNYTTLKEGSDSVPKMGDAGTKDQFLLIGFGHNDEKSEDADRYTDPKGDYTTEGSFAWTLYEKYIKPALDAGVTPVVATPIVRYDSSGNYTGAKVHVDNGGDYAQAIRDLCEVEELQGKVILADLTDATKKLYMSSNEAAEKFHSFTSAEWVDDEQTQKKPAGRDDTHINSYGAKMVAWLLGDVTKDSALNAYWLDKEKPSEEADYEDAINKDYVIPDYVAPTEEQMETAAKIWPAFTDANDRQWYATAFGDIGGNNKATADNFPATVENGSVTLEAKGNGKISADKDAFFFYYTRLPAGTIYELSATAEVIRFGSEGSDGSISTDNQMSYGLMARDDIYLNKYITSTMGDYVVAGTYKKGTVNCFGRKSKELLDGATPTNKYITAGDIANLKIASNSDGVTLTFGENAPVSGGFDYALTTNDPNYIYVGFYVTRNAKVKFSNIDLNVIQEPQE